MRDVEQVDGCVGFAEKNGKKMCVKCLTVRNILFICLYGCSAMILISFDFAIAESYSSIEEAVRVYLLV